MRQGNLRKQLQIDHQAQPPFQLKKRRSLFARQYLVHHRHVLQPQRLRFHVHLHRVPHINQRILIRHRCPRLCVLLEQRILCVVHFMQVVRVVFVDGPELLRLRIRQRHILPNHLHFHCSYILPQQSNVRVRHCRAHDSLHSNLLSLRSRPRQSHPPAQRRRDYHARNKRPSQSRRSRHFAIHDLSPYLVPLTARNTENSKSECMLTGTEACSPVGTTSPQENETKERWDVQRRKVPKSLQTFACNSFILSGC